MQNAGGCRRGISLGAMLGRKCDRCPSPFSNTFVTINMEGLLIKETLEDALNNFLRDDDLKGSTGSFPASAGLRWELDYTAEFGNRVSNIEMNRRLEEDEWTPLDMSSNYTVAITCECTICITCWQEKIYMWIYSHRIETSWHLILQHIWLQLKMASLVWQRAQISRT